MPQRIVNHLQRSRWTLPVTLAAVVILIAINEVGFDNSRGALATLDQRVEVRRDVQIMMRRVVDAESGLRGLLLTGRREYMEPYESSIGIARGLAASIAAAYAGDAQARPFVTAMKQGVDGKLSEMATTLELYEQGRHEAWKDLLMTNIGKEKMDNVRQASEDLFQLESARIVAGRDGVSSTLRFSRFGLNTMAVLTLLSLWLFRRQTKAIDASNRQHAEALAAERDHLESEVARRTADLTELAHHLQTVREDERSRLARELHDELGALLTAAKLDAARLKRGLAGPVAESEARLAHLSETINRGIELKRRIIEDLHPSSLSNLGLRSALEIQAREFAQRSELHVRTDLADLQLDERAGIAVYRIVQESLTNIAKHAGAHQVEITLRQLDRGVEVAVGDDGSGFDHRAVRGSRHGLLGMRHRVEALGGRLSIDSTPGRGTRLRAWLPNRPAEVEAAGGDARGGAVPPPGAPSRA